MGEETRATATLDPLIGVDIDRLEKEMEQYQSLLDEDADYAYRIAEEARQQNLDPKPFVEIPRASDLASRTEKLLIEHLEAAKCDAITIVSATLLLVLSSLK